MTLRVRYFSKLGPIMEGSVDDGITDFRSLTYTLANEEPAKERAVSEAMRRAVGRASAALEPKGQKVGVLRFANLEGEAADQPFEHVCLSASSIFGHRKPGGLERRWRLGEGEKGYAGQPAGPAAAGENYGKRFCAVRISDSLTGTTKRLPFGSATATMCGHGAEPG